jgi:triacylglycerol lipase
MAMRTRLRTAAAYLAAARVYLHDEQAIHARLDATIGPHRCSGPVSDTPVVLVHGFLANRSCFLPTIEGLHHLGFGHVQVASYSAVSDDVAAAAARVADKVRRVADKHGVERVHVVAHSMGGIATLYAASRLGLDEHLAGVVALATPYSGSWWAMLGPRALQIGRTARQIAPGSPLLGELRRDALTLEAPWVSMWSKRDEIVPGWSAQLPGGINLQLPPVGHVEMLSDPRVIAQIAAQLRPAAGLPKAS